MARARLTRRRLLRAGLLLSTALGAGGLLDPRPAAAAPSPPPMPAVAVGGAAGYDRAEVTAGLAGLFDLLGGLGRLVAGRTVTVKLNLTGTADGGRLGRPPGETYQTHPTTALALADLLGRAGARRVRFVDSLSGGQGPDDLARRAGWDWPALRAAAPDFAFEDTRNRGTSGRYARLAVPWGGYVFPAFDLNAAYEQTDVFVSLAKLKQHATAGLTLSIKNLFGIAPNALYGDDAGDESAGASRLRILHAGLADPPAGAPGELDRGSPRRETWRVPRVTADLLAARPIDLAIVDGIATLAGGEGPWVPGVRPIRPGVLLAGFDPVATDAVAAAIMGFDPRAEPGHLPFPGENHLALAARAGLGRVDLAAIEVRGRPIEQARFPFGPAVGRAAARLQYG